ncbi:MAG: hypothetical protein IPM21_12070 [Acidobacteria bacterium]|nr:hypothetical protein [Acidobacteriota bacterium]
MGSPGIVVFVPLRRFVLSILAAASLSLVVWASSTSASVRGVATVVGRTVRRLRTLITCKCKKGERARQAAERFRAFSWSSWTILSEA